MLRFQFENFFWLLILIPILVFIWIGYERLKKVKLSDFASISNLKRLVSFPDTGIRRSQVWLVLAALVMMIFAMANLQKGEYSPGQGQTRGTDVMIALDVSKSMNAQDVSPSRIELSKLLIQRLIKNTKTDRIGLLVFAGQADVLIPLSTDYISIQNALSGVQAGMSPVQGTSISSALQMAYESLDENKNKYKAVVLITDGEDHEAGINPNLNKLKSKGARIFAVGVGSEKGAEIIDPDTGKPKKDSKGNVVISKYNKDLIKSIAKKGNGDYIYMETLRQAANDLEADIDGIGSNVYASANFQKQASYFYIFVIIAFLLLVIENIMSTVNHQSKTAWLIATLLISPIFSQAQVSKSKQKESLKMVYEGNKKVKDSKPKEASEYYLKALKADPDNSKASYNLATTEYLQQNASAARDLYQKSLNSEKDNLERAKTLYNIGNTYMLEKNWDGAIEEYKKSLILNPNDENTRYNLAYAQKMKKNDKNKNKNNKNNKDDKKNQNKNNQDQKNQKKSGDKDKQDPKDGDKDKGKPKENKAPSKPQKLSKDQAERMLNALRNQEKKNKKGKKVDGKPVQVNEKDW